MNCDNCRNCSCGKNVEQQPSACPPPPKKPTPPPRRLSCSGCGFTAPENEYKHVCVIGRVIVISLIVSLCLSILAILIQCFF
jgi:hypothetical protein